MTGLLSRIGGWLGDDTNKTRMAGLSHIFGSLGQGQAPNVAPYVGAIQEQQQQQQFRDSLGGDDMMSRFSDEERSFLAGLPPQVAQKLIAERMFAQPDPWAGMKVINGQIVGMGEGGPEVIGDYRTPEGPKQTSAMQNYDALIALGMDPTTAMERAFSGGTNVNVNMGDGAPGIGKLSTDYGYVLDPETRQPVIDPDTGLPQAAPVPGSAAARELEANEAARQGQQGLTARQLNPTIDDITTARDLAENGIGTTGMFSGMIQRVPGVGQDSIDMAATIDAIGSGISLENLNQMRQNSPTGGALGNVSDKQSALLSEAFGSLRQSMSKEQFLYNLARVENTLNDIVHGEGHGPERHDMTTLRQRLRGGGQGQRQQQPVAEQDAPAGSFATPTSRAQYDALPSGARFQAPDGSIRIKP